MYLCTRFLKARETVLILFQLSSEICLIRLDKVKDAYAKVRLHHRCGARIEIFRR